MNKVKSYLPWVLTVLFAALLVVSMVGGNQPGQGGVTRFPNSDITAKSLTLSSGNLSITSGTITSTGGASSFATTTVNQFTEGGSVFATTTTAATETLTEADLLNNKVLRFLGSATAAAITVTLPATSTMTSLLPDAGDTRTWVIENGYTAAATTTTIAAGTGVDLQEPDGQNVVIGINNYGWLRCFREVSTDVVCRVDETIPAD